ncbi:MAG: pesticin [Bryobacteraceae bacterium]|nr:pesticin [Bryobacteraceae bacterium]
MPGTVVIKKYENRRLYDTEGSRYVNLDEVAALIRAGRDVRVVDAKTNEDLTRSILTQIIVEESRGGEAGLPLELLRQMIVTSDQARHQFLEWYLKNAFEAYQRMTEGFQSRIGQMVNPLESMAQMFRGAPGSVPFFPFAPMAAQPAPAPDPPPAPDLDELAELKRRIDELEKQLDSRAPLAARPRTRKPK